jgi:hypothetical protein
VISTTCPFMSRRWTCFCASSILSATSFSMSSAAWMSSFGLTSGMSGLGSSSSAICSIGCLPRPAIAGSSRHSKRSSSKRLRIFTAHSLSANGDGQSASRAPAASRTSASQLVSSSRAAFAAFARTATGKTPAKVGVSTWTNATTAACPASDTAATVRSAVFLALFRRLVGPLPITSRRTSSIARAPEPVPEGHSSL